jgi:hypothetical protein
MEEVRKIIFDEATKGDEIFEAFGMKFPAGQITIWGSIVLLSIQLCIFLYFLYLKQLSGRLRSHDPGLSERNSPRRARRACFCFFAAALRILNRSRSGGQISIAHVRMLSESPRERPMNLDPQTQGATPGERRCSSVTDNASLSARHDMRFHATSWCVLLLCVESGVFNGRVAQTFVPEPLDSITKSPRK